MTEQRKAVIKNADMSEEMQQDAVDIASQALAKYNIEKVRFCHDFVCYHDEDFITTKIFRRRRSLWIDQHTHPFTFFLISMDNSL
jgi:hypothetical protein